MEREVIKLKAQIEILQNKSIPSFSQRSNVQGENGEKLSM